MRVYFHFQTFFTDDVVINLDMATRRYLSEENYFNS